MANEKRLVDANVFIRDLTAMKSVYDAIALDGMIKALNEAPTADAVEVVHGAWIPVSVQKPEENKGVKVYDDGHMSLISVLVCGGNRGVNIANRFQIRPGGIPHLDEHATDGWEWSVGNEDITHWMPLPEAPKGR